MDIRYDRARPLPFRRHLGAVIFVVALGLHLGHAEAVNAVDVIAMAIATGEWA